MLFVHGFHKLVPDSTHFVADSAKLLVIGAILSNTVFLLFVRGIQNSREDQRKVVMLHIPQKRQCLPVAESAYNSEKAQFGLVMLKQSKNLFATF